MRALRKHVAWPAVFATILLAFGAVTFVVAQPIAIIVDRAAWSVGLADQYGTTLPSDYLNLLSWVVAAILCTALVRWLGALGTQHSVFHRRQDVTSEWRLRIPNSSLRHRAEFLRTAP